MTSSEEVAALTLAAQQAAARGADKTAAAYDRAAEEAAQRLQATPPAQCANCGRPAREDYAYSSTICEQWPLCRPEGEEQQH